MRRNNDARTLNAVETYRVQVTLGSSHLDILACDFSMSISTSFSSFSLFPSVHLNHSELRVSYTFCIIVCISLIMRRFIQ